MCSGLDTQNFGRTTAHAANIGLAVNFICP